MLVGGARQEAGARQRESARQSAYGGEGRRAVRAGLRELLAERLSGRAGGGRWIGDRDGLAADDQSVGSAGAGAAVAVGDLDRDREAARDGRCAGECSAGCQRQAGRQHSGIDRECGAIHRAGLREVLAEGRIHSACCYGRVRDGDGRATDGQVVGRTVARAAG